MIASQLFIKLVPIGKRWAWSCSRVDIGLIGAGMAFSRREAIARALRAAARCPIRPRPESSA